MKKKVQKRLGNKGFSLVELIVVIAIMAVLVGVLAPTLISNIDKSRKSKDEQNIDMVRGSIVTALAEEDVYNKFVPSGDTSNIITLNGTTGVIATTVADSVAEFKKITDIIGTTSIALSSNDYKNTTVTFSIDKAGAVTWTATNNNNNNTTN